MIVSVCLFLFRYDTVFTNKMYLEVVGTISRTGSLKPPILVLPCYFLLSLVWSGPDPKAASADMLPMETYPPTGFLHDRLEEGHTANLFISFTS